MKYGEAISCFSTEKETSCHIWKVSEKAGFYMTEGLDKEAVCELAGNIITACNVLIEELKKEAPAEDGTTEVFEELKKEAEESLALKNCTRELEEKLPYLVRRSTGEKFVINRNIFKLGKDAAYVDCLVDNNPAISRNHADIVRKKDGFYVRDKGSLNHTFVDGRKLEGEKLIKLESGSLLQLADEVFEFIEE